MKSASYSGSCLCGKVRYQVAKLEPLIGHCHCTMCRKFHGAAFATFGEVKRVNFIWLAGEDLLHDYVASNGTTRRFCAECGSSMIFISANDDGEVIEFSLATLDSNIEERPDGHIYVGNKANWYAISDSLPQHHAGREQVNHAESQNHE